MFSLNRPLVIGHRGVSAFYPENTLESFRAAFGEFKADMIEFDVHLSKDGIPVIIHDATLQRTTDAHGYVSKFTVKELKSFNAGFYFDPENNKRFPFRSQSLQIPLFEEVLENFHQKLLSVEIKEKSPAIVERVLKLIKTYEAEDRCIVGSKYSYVSQKMWKTAPHIYRFLSMQEIFNSHMAFLAGKKILKEKKAVASMPLERCGLSFEKKEFIDYLHEAGIKVFYWTVNSEEKIKSLTEKKVDGIITDDPNLMTKNSF